MQRRLALACVLIGSAVTT